MREQRLAQHADAKTITGAQRRKLAAIILAGALVALLAYMSDAQAPTMPSAVQIAAEAIAAALSRRK